MYWIWDPAKNEENRRNHEGLSFETAQLVFDDPLAETILTRTPTRSVAAPSERLAA